MWMWCGCCTYTLTLAANAIEGWFFTCVRPWSQLATSSAERQEGRFDVALMLCRLPFMPSPHDMLIFDIEVWAFGHSQYSHIHYHSFLPPLICFIPSWCEFALQAIHSSALFLNIRTLKRLLGFYLATKLFKIFFFFC